MSDEKRNLTRRIQRDATCFAVIGALLYALVRLCCIKWGWFPNVHREYWNILIPCFLAIVSGFVCRGISRFRSDRLLYFFVAAMTFVPMFVANDFVEREANTCVYIGRLTPQTLKQATSATFVHIDTMYADVSRRRSHVDSYYVPGRYHSTLHHDNYYACPILGVENCFIGQSRKGSGGKIAKERLSGRFYRLVRASDNLRQYTIAARLSRGPIDRPMPDPIVFELTPDAKVLPNRGRLWWVVIALLAGNLLIGIAGRCSDLEKGAKKKNRKKKSESSRVREWMRVAFNPEWLPLWLVAAVCIGCYLWTVVCGLDPFSNSAMFLDEMGAASSWRVVGERQYWRLLVSIFMHGSFFHLLGNLVSYAIIVFICLALYRIRSWVIIAAFLLTGVVSNWIVIDQQATVIVGASGAIFGLVGVSLTCGLVNYVRWRKNGVLLLGTLAFTVVTLALSTAGGISLLGHFAGLVAGFVGGWLVAWHIGLLSSEGPAASSAKKGKKVGKRKDSDGQ